MPSRGQPVTLLYTAWDTGASAGKTGDVANHTLRWSKDGVLAAPTNAPTEADAANAPGEYSLALTATECTCNLGKLVGKSSTANIAIIPVAVAFEQLPTAAPAAAGGLPTVGTGAGQLNPSGTGKLPATLAATDVAGDLPVNVVQWLGAAPNALIAGQVDANAGAPTAAAIRTEMDAHSTQFAAIVSANTAILNAATNITSNTARTVFVAPSQMPIPAAGSTAFEVDLLLFDLHGQNEVPDSPPTVHARNASGTSRDDHLSATTMVLIGGATGRYRVTYTVQSTDPAEQLIFDFIVTVATVARTVSGPATVATSFATTFTAADRTTLGTVATAVSANLDAAVTSRLAGSAYATPPTPAAVATATLTSTTAGDYAVPGSIGYQVANGIFAGFPCTVTAVTTSTVTFTLNNGMPPATGWTVQFAKGLDATQSRNLASNSGGNTWALDRPFDPALPTPDPSYTMLALPDNMVRTAATLAAIQGELDARNLTAATTALVAGLAALTADLGVQATVGAGSTASLLNLTAAAGSTLSSAVNAYTGCTVKVVASTAAGTRGTGGVAGNYTPGSPAVLQLSTPLPAAPTVGDTVQIY